MMMMAVAESNYIYHHRHRGFITEIKEMKMSELSFFQELWEFFPSVRPSLVPSILLRLKVPIIVTQSTAITEQTKLQKDSERCFFSGNQLEASSVEAVLLA